MDIIIAPHPDDELIGCYEIINGNKGHKHILYSLRDFNSERYAEAMSLKLKFEDLDLIFTDNFLTEINKLTCPSLHTYYFPDPIYETHPDHREFGILGEQLFRKGYDIIFYSINMNAPYVHKVTSYNNKEDILSSVYKSQQDLWKYEKKYILFEGRCKWMK